jgi:hypothetical protein
LFDFWDHSDLKKRSKKKLDNERLLAKKADNSAQSD